MNLRGTVTRSVKRAGYEASSHSSLQMCCAWLCVAVFCELSFLRLCNCQPTTKVLQLANCAAGFMWISKQGFLETGLGMLLDRHGECTGLCMHG